MNKNNSYIWIIIAVVVLVGGYFAYQSYSSSQKIPAVTKASPEVQRVLDDLNK